ncbi:hypothetical protein ACLOJK_039892 [Asimina triloba]
MSGEILVIPFHGQGHLFPSIELCIHLAERNYHITLVLPSAFAASVSPSLRHNPQIHIAELSSSPSPLETATHGHPPPPMSPLTDEIFADFLSTRCSGPDSPICAVVDVMMSWTHNICRKFKIPTVSFFTSGACSAAMEYAVWKLRLENPNPVGDLPLPGLPDDVRLTLSDLTLEAPPPPPRHLPDDLAHRGPPPPPRGSLTFPNLPRPHHPVGSNPAQPHPPPRHLGGPPPPPSPGSHGQRPPWVGETEGSTALLINTCEDLERPFLEYVAGVTGKPVWGVGPLLPAQFWWRPDGSLIHDAAIRAGRRSDVSEDDVSRWLDSQPHGSVIYVAFGSEVGPTDSEMEALAAALEESDGPFIWVLSNPHGPRPHSQGEGDSGGFFPEDLAHRAGGRGLIIRGWAPQLLILSHPSIAAFVTHCGWNSTLEAMGCGVTLLAWPIRGDQHYNAKLISSHLRIGLMIRASDAVAAVKKEDIVRGLERLKGDAETRSRAAALRNILGCGFPASSAAALDAFSSFLRQQIPPST